MRKITFLLAFLCASMMGWAINWNSYSWIGDGAGGGAYSNKYKMTLDAGQSYVNIQQPGWAGEAGIYTTFPAGISGCTLPSGKYAIDGAGMVLYLSAFTDQETEITVTHGLGTCTFTVYYVDGTPSGAPSKKDPELSLNETAVTLDATVPETFQIVASRKGDGAISYVSDKPGIATVSNTGEVTAVGRGKATITVSTAETDEYEADSKTLNVTVNGPINWDAVDWLGGSGDKYKMVVDPTTANIVNVQGSAGGNGIYVTFPGAGWGACSLNSDDYVTQGAGRWYLLTAFPLQYNEFTQVCEGKTYTFNVYYADGTPAGGLVETVTLDQHAATIEVEQALTLSAEVLPAAASDKSLDWTSNNPDVATVVNGVVTGVAPGEAVITATAHDGSGIYDQCTVTVEAIAEKTWWGMETISEVPLMYSITRNTNKTLTYTVYFGGDASTWVKQINVNGSYFNLAGYDNVDRVVSYTTETTHNAGTKITPNHFFYFGGPTIQLADAYIVGASNTKPSTSVESVQLSISEATIAPGESVQLTVSVLPSYVEDKTVAWVSGNSSIATVTDAGLVEAVAEGDVVITATSNADGTKSASCTIHVVAALEPATWYGAGTFIVNGNAVAANYSITRNADRTLTFRTVLSEPVAGIAMQIFDGTSIKSMTQSNEDKNAEWTSTDQFVEGSVHTEFYFYAAYTGGAGSIAIPSYTVGASNTQPHTLLALNDAVANSAKIAAYDQVLVDAVINRTFPNTDEWYTLCLPFDLSDAQLTDVFGAGYTLAELVGSEDRGSLIHLNFNYSPAFVAGKAYLIRPGEGVTEAPTFEGVVIKDVDPSVTPQKTEAEHMHFQGTFDYTTLNQANQRFVGPENYLYTPDTEIGTHMKAFRCYFTIPGGSSASAPGKRAVIVFGPQQTTDIDQTSQEPRANSQKLLLNGQLYIIRDGKTYNVMGVEIR